MSPRGVGIAIGIALLGSLVPPAGATMIHTAPAGVPPWAYGGFLAAAGNGEVGQVAVTYNDHTDYAVVLSQINDTPSLLTLTLTRAIGTEGFLAACYPDCTAPEYNLTARSAGAEFENASLTLTREATVAENGTNVSALGLVYESLTLSAQITINLSWQEIASPGGPEGEWFNASSAANSTGAFQMLSPLGLVPATLAANDSWSSEARAEENASVTYGGGWSYAGALLPPSGGTISGQVAPVSPTLLSVAGRDAGPLNSTGLAEDVALSLATTGNGSTLLEGGLLVPNATYRYAGFGGGCDLAQRPCDSNESTPALDYGASDPSHLGWEAASATVAPFSLELTGAGVYDTPNGTAFWPASAGLPPEPSGPSGSSNVSSGLVVQGYPEEVPDAEAVIAALRPAPTLSVPPTHRTVAGHAFGVPTRTVRGVEGPTLGNLTVLPVPKAPLGTLQLLLLAVAAVGGASLGAAAVVRRRRGRPPPPEEEPASSAEEPPAEPADEDPLGYVW